MMLEVQTSRFGKLEVPEDATFLFPKGLVGFEHLKRYILVDSQKGNTVQWLQSLEDPDVAFLVSAPETFVPGFQLRLPPQPEVGEGREGDRNRRLRTLTLLHVDRAQGVLHVHVQSPLLLDPTTHRGVQVITDAPEPTIPVPLKSP